MSIELKEVSYKYPGETINVLNRVSISVPKGEILAIMGSSGSGKSTLLKLISSFILQENGDIHINDVFTNTKKPYSNFGYICQGASEMTYPWLRVEANLLKPLKRRNLLNAETQAYATELLSKFKLTFRKNAFPYLLSGGELKRLSVAMALVYKPDVLLLDEPFSGLDLRLTQELWEFMLDYLKTVKPTGILITHNLEEAALLADKVGFLLSDKSIAICPKGRNLFVENISIESLQEDGFLEYKKFLKSELMQALNEKAN